MIHDTRMTLEKIGSRLKLIESLVYRSKWVLPPFRYKMFPKGNPGLPVDEIEAETSWESLSAYQYWGQWNSEFVLFNSFSLPEYFRGCEGVSALFAVGRVRAISVILRRLRMLMASRLLLVTVTIKSWNYR